MDQVAAGSEQGSKVGGGVRGGDWSSRPAQWEGVGVYVERGRGRRWGKQNPALGPGEGRFG